MFSFIRSIFSDGDDITGSEVMIDTGPAVNIDGTPMCGDVDIHGNPFGVTSSDDDTFNNCGSSMFDD